MQYTHSLFQDLSPDESETVSAARGCYSSSSVSSRFPKSSEQHYHDTRRILYPDLVVVNYDYRRGTHVRRYYRRQHS